MHLRIGIILSLCQQVGAVGGTTIFSRIKNWYERDLELFSRGGQFFLVPGRDKYTMWERQPLSKKLFIHYILVPGRQVPFLVRGSHGHPGPHGKITYAHFYSKG